jgi:hypothetical protein
LKNKILIFYIVNNNIIVLKILKDITMQSEKIPKFLRYSDPNLKYVEYHAILRILADGNNELLEKNYPNVHAKMSEMETEFIETEQDTFKGKAFEMLHAGAFDNELSGLAMMNVYRFLESEGKVMPPSYDEEVVDISQSAVLIPVLSKAQKRIKAEIKKKKRDQSRIARENYQRKRLGEHAFVSKDLYAEVRKITYEHLMIGGSRDELVQIAAQFAKERELTEIKAKTLCDEIMLSYFDKLNFHNKKCFNLLSSPNNQNKTIFYLWHQLSRTYEQGIEFPLSTEQGSKMASCSKSTYPIYIKEMCRMKILRRVSKGIRGANSKKADVYKLLISVNS